MVLFLGTPLTLGPQADFTSLWASRSGGFMKHTCACLRFSVRPYGDLPLNPDCEQTAGGPTPVQGYWNAEWHWQVLHLRGLCRGNISVQAAEHTLALGSKLPLISLEAETDFFFYSFFWFFFIFEYFLILLGIWGLSFSVHLDFKVELARRNRNREESRAIEYCS